MLDRFERKSKLVEIPPEGFATRDGAGKIGPAIGHEQPGIGDEFSGALAASAVREDFEVDFVTGRFTEIEGKVGKFHGTEQFEGGGFANAPVGLMGRTESGAGIAEAKSFREERSITQGGELHVHGDGLGFFEVMAPGVEPGADPLEGDVNGVWQDIRQHGECALFTPAEWDAIDAAFDQSQAPEAPGLAAGHIAGATDFGATGRQKENGKKNGNFLKEAHPGVRQEQTTAAQFTHGRELQTAFGNSGQRQRPGLSIPVRWFPIQN